MLQGCGGNSSRAPFAAISNIHAADTIPGVSPFIAFIDLRGNNLKSLDSVGFRIEPMTGTVSKPVSVRYQMDYLRKRGYVTTANAATIPVFGLYANFTNHVVLDLRFADRSEKQVPVTITSGPYEDVVFNHPARRVARQPGSALGFDFFVMKSALAGPVVVDTDGYVRWARGKSLNAISSAFVDNGFLVGDGKAPVLRRLELDGTSTRELIISSTYTGFQHNIDAGRSGMLVEVNKQIDGQENFESTLAEITPAGAVLKEWDIGDIIASYMRSHGDDPKAFVGVTQDWLHMNAAAYDAHDNSLVISSREDFLLKIDYDSNEIRWIFGDPTKYWHAFPSLRAKALTLVGNGLYPIGQHAASITSDGLLMVFNDGTRSLSMPPGYPLGEERSYSAVSAYSIDAASRTAREAWRFDYGQSIYSELCSSAYEAAGKSLLVSYALADRKKEARLVGLNAAHQVVFDFQYANPDDKCSVSWNAVPVPFDDLTFN
ncbi:MAG TPA: aryl-sulfate sulfotransferase [Steroidobacteraceae bacterium]|nr:aryl-sulfate sulfotransferase [Steroidobacteraceae bacterium]